MEKSFTLTIFTENKSGLLNRLAIILTRRKINIDSLTTSPSEIEGVYRFTILIKTTGEEVRKIVKQMEKQIEVIKAYYYESDEVVYQEIALYKVATNLLHQGNAIEQIIRDNHARILTLEPEYIVIEKTGQDSEIQILLDILEPYGVYEFVRSGRVAVAKQMNNLGAYLKELPMTND
jgi:acetolactate synthase I/III small subunit